MRVKNLKDMPDGPMKRRLEAQLQGEQRTGGECDPAPAPAPAQAASGGIRHKYGAVQTERDGMKFGSRAEARHYDNLKLQIAAGEVIFFLRQVPFHFPGGVKYVCDYEVFYADGHVEFHEIKGMEMPIWKLKMRLMAQHYPAVEVKVIKYS